MKKVLWMAGLSLGCLLLETSVLPFVWSPLRTIDLLLLLPLFYGFREGPRTGFAMGVVAGLALDLTSGLALGLHVLLFGVTGYLAGRLTGAVRQDPLFFPMVSAFVSVFLVHVAASLLLRLFGLAPLAAAAQAGTPFSAAASMLAAPFLAAWVKRMPINPPKKTSEFI